MLGRFALLCCIVTMLSALARPAHGWIENHVLAAEARVELAASGKALIEHRITLKSNGSERLRELTIRGVDPDAAPSGQSYVIPARDALSGSLEAALPLLLERAAPTAAPPSATDDGLGDEPVGELRVRVDAEGGLPRGTYQLVVRYETDLRARGLLRRQGALVEVHWRGPVWEDGLNNTRVTFAVPAAPTPPRASDGPGADAADSAPDDDPVGSGPIGPEQALPSDDTMSASRYLVEVRRGTEQDEIELLRSYSPKGAVLGWTIRIDQRALEPLPQPAPPVEAETRVTTALLSASDPRTRLIILAAALSLFIAFTVLVALKGREVRRLAAEAKATVPGALPLPLWVRAPLAALALVGGLAAELLFDRPLVGAGAVVLGALLAAHGVARLDPAASRRGPGRWLSVTEAEGLCLPPRFRGALFDSSTRTGRLLLGVLLAAVGAAAAWLAPRAPYQAIFVALDSIVLLAIFGTGRRIALPPDLSVAPIPFLRQMVRRIRRAKRAPDLRLVPRIRVPLDGVDPDELRLMVVPRVPVRGLLGIEVALTYAIGLGAPVGFPELLLRLRAGSPCEQAVRTLARMARVTPGRKPDEIVLGFSPRLPTARMTTELLLALAARVTASATDEPLAQAPDQPRRGQRDDESSPLGRAAA